MSFFFPHLPFSAVASLTCLLLFMGLAYGGFSLKLFPPDFVCDRHQFVSSICRSLPGLFMHPHRAELPTPLPRRYPAYMGLAPLWLPFYLLWALFLLFPHFVGSLLFFVFSCLCLFSGPVSLVFSGPIHHPPSATRPFPTSPPQ
jgi:hypothetical protein